MAAAIVGDRDAARDAVQEAFAVRKRETFRGEGPLEAWLWRTVVNAARTQSRRSCALVSEAEPGDGLNGREDEAAERVRLAVAVLPEKQRLVLFPRYYGDLDYSQRRLESARARSGPL